MKKKPFVLRFCRVFAVVTLSFAAVMAALCIGLYIRADKEIDEGADEMLFATLGEAQTTYIYASKGGRKPHDALKLETYNRAEYDTVYSSNDCVMAKSEEISQYLKDAFISVEDHRFYDHDGVDWFRTAGAAANMVLRFDKRFGGSTITQQLVKNVVGENDVTVKRKIKEMVRATRLEKKYSKDEILTMYLNVVPLSSHCTGVYSASVYYFGKLPKELDAAEAATIAAITNAPTKYDPVLHPENNIYRRNIILAEMKKYGYLSEEEYGRAVKKPLVLSADTKDRGGEVHDWFTETVCDEVTEDLMKEHGMSYEAATRLVYNGGLRIYSTVDTEAQGTVNEYFSDERNFLICGTEELDYSFILIDPFTGDVLAVAGGVGEKRANRLQNGACAVKRPPGSSLKPIALYAPLLESKKINYATVVADVPKVYGDGDNVYVWPRNSPNIYSGRIPIHSALAYSKNAVAVRLYEMLGAKAIYQTLTSLGITSIVKQGTSYDGKSKVTDMAVAPLALGQLSEGVTLRELAAAYVPFDSAGVYHASRSYVAVTDRDGKLLLKKDPENKRIWSEQTAFIMTKMMEEVTGYGTARSVKLKYSMDVAGKTGTSGSDLDRLFVGYTPGMLAAVRCTSNDKAPISKRGRSHLAIWDDVMTEIYRRKPGSCSDGLCEFKAPRGVVRVSFCRDSGHRETGLCKEDLRGNRTEYGFFTADNCPTGECSLHTEAYLDAVTGKIEKIPNVFNYFSQRISIMDDGNEKPFHDVKTLDSKYYLWYYTNKEENGEGTAESEENNDLPHGTESP